MHNKIEKKTSKRFGPLIDKAICLCFQQNPPCLISCIHVSLERNNNNKP